MFVFCRGLPPEDIENRLEFRWAHWITATQPAKCTSPSKNTWSPGLKIGVVIFSPCLRAVPQPRTSKPAQGLILHTENDASRDMEQLPFPWSGAVAKKSPQNSSIPAKMLFTTQLKTLILGSAPTTAWSSTLSASAFPTLPSYLNLQYLPQSQWLYCHSHLVGLCHWHTESSLHRKSHSWRLFKAFQLGNGKLGRKLHQDGGTGLEHELDPESSSGCSVTTETDEVIATHLHGRGTQDM